jgi:hypothetical protein
LEEVKLELDVPYQNMGQRKLHRLPRTSPKPTCGPGKSHWRPATDSTSSTSHLREITVPGQKTTGRRLRLSLSPFLSHLPKPTRTVQTRKAKEVEVKILK